MSELQFVKIYTDGACIGNPGPGGYGVVLIYNNIRRELSGGSSQTTNNRMELMAAIVGLQALKYRCKVAVYSDSAYLVNAISEGWAQKWRSTGWKRGKNGKALNPDLWEELLQLCSFHKVEFRWVRGHKGNPENERCDQLAVDAAQKQNMPCNFD